MFLPYLEKLNVQISCSYEGKCKHGTILNVPILIPLRVHASVSHFECIYLSIMRNILANESTVVFLGKLWVPPRRTGCCVVAFGGWCPITF